MKLLFRAAKIILSRHVRTIAVFLGVVAAMVVWWVRRPQLGAPQPGALPTEASSGAAASAAGLDGAEDIGPDDALQPRAILSRVWFDKYPDKPREVTSMWIFLSGGLALYERGSSYKFGLELFDFERQNDRVVISSLQDKKALTTPFKIERCDHEPFDLCLTFETAVRGPKTFYGFSRRSDQDAHAPAGTAFRRAAEARAPSVPRD